MQYQQQEQRYAPYEDSFPCEQLSMSKRDDNQSSDGNQPILKDQLQMVQKFNDLKDFSGMMGSYSNESNGGNFFIQNEQPSLREDSVGIENKYMLGDVNSRKGTPLRYVPSSEQLSSNDQNYKIQSQVTNSNGDNMKSFSSPRLKDHHLQKNPMSGLNTLSTPNSVIYNPQQKVVSPHPMSVSSSLSPLNSGVKGLGGNQLTFNEGETIPSISGYVLNKQSAFEQADQILDASQKLLNKVREQSNDRNKANHLQTQKLSTIMSRECDRSSIYNKQTESASPNAASGTQNIGQLNQFLSSEGPGTNPNSKMNSKNVTQNLNINENDTEREGQFNNDHHKLNVMSNSSMFPSQRADTVSGDIEVQNIYIHPGLQPNSMSSSLGKVSLQNELVKEKAAIISQRIDSHNNQRWQQNYNNVNPNHNYTQRQEDTQFDCINDGLNYVTSEGKLNQQSSPATVIQNDTFCVNASNLSKPIGAYQQQANTLDSTNLGTYSQRIQSKHSTQYNFLQNSQNNLYSPTNQGSQHLTNAGSQHMIVHKGDQIFSQRSAMLINNTSSVENTNEMLSPSVRNENQGQQENPYDEYGEHQNKIEVDSEGNETFRSPREQFTGGTKKMSSSTNQNTSNAPKPRKDDLRGDVKLQSRSYAHLMPLQMKLSEHILKSSSSMPGARHGQHGENRTLNKSRSALAQFEQQSSHSQQKGALLNLRSSKSQRTYSIPSPNIIAQNIDKKALRNSQEHLPPNVINGYDLIRVNSSDPQSLINSGKKSALNDYQDEKPQKPVCQKRVNHKMNSREPSVLSPINQDGNMSRHQIDSFNQEFNFQTQKHHSQVNSIGDEKNAQKLNEQSFVNQLEQLNQSSIHHNKRVSGPSQISSGVQGENAQNLGNYESEYVQQRMQNGSVRLKSQYCQNQDMYDKNLQSSHTQSDPQIIQDQGDDQIQGGVISQQTQNLHQDLLSQNQQQTFLSGTLGASGATNFLQTDSKIGLVGHQITEGTVSEGGLNAMFGFGGLSQGQGTGQLQFRNHDTKFQNEKINGHASPTLGNQIESKINSTPSEIQRLNQNEIQNQDVYGKLPQFQNQQNFTSLDLVGSSQQTIVEQAEILSYNPKKMRRHNSKQYSFALSQQKITARESVSRQEPKSSIEYSESVESPSQKQVHLTHRSNNIQNTTATMNQNDHQLHINFQEDLRQEQAHDVTQIANNNTVLHKIDNENDITQVRNNMRMHLNTQDNRGSTQRFFNKEQPLMRRDLLPPSGKTRELQRSEINEASESFMSKRSKSQHFKQSLNDRIFDQYGIQLNSSQNKLGKTSNQFQSTRSFSQSNLTNNHTQQTKFGGMHNDSSKVPSETPNSSQKPAVVIDLLKQELLSAKRQIRDQESSNKFLKKENLKLDHEKNLTQIKVNQDQEQIRELTQHNHELKQILEGDRINHQEKLQKQLSFCEQLQKMNDLQQNENQILQSKLQKTQEISVKHAEKFEKEVVEIDKKKQKHIDKIYSQILQLNSVAAHLKDLVRMSEVQKQNKHCEDIEGFIEANFESTVKNVIRQIQQHNQELGAGGVKNSESSLEQAMGSEKLQVRSQNFKKFRQSTNDLIQKLFASQLESKKLIIHNLETQLIKTNNDAADLSESQKQKILQLENQVDDLQQKCGKLEKDLKYQENQVLPQIQDQSKAQKDRMAQQFEQTEEELRSKIIKQKYQLKEQYEKNRLTKNENSDLKIQLEQIKYQNTDLQTQNQALQVKFNSQVLDFQEKECKIHLKAFEQAKDEFEAATKKAQEQAKIQKLIEDDKKKWGVESGFLNSKGTVSQDDMSIQATTRSFIMEKLKNQQLKQTQEKQIQFHNSEKQLMERQLEEYKETVIKQNQLIQVLQNKMQIQSQMASNSQLGGINKSYDLGEKQMLGSRETIGMQPNSTFYNVMTTKDSMEIGGKSNVKYKTARQTSRQRQEQRDFMRQNQENNQIHANGGDFQTHMRIESNTQQLSGLKTIDSKGDEIVDANISTLNLEKFVKQDALQQFTKSNPFLSRENEDSCHEQSMPTMQQTQINSHQSLHQGYHANNESKIQTQYRQSKHLSDIESLSQSQRQTMQNSSTELINYPQQNFQKSSVLTAYQDSVSQSNISHTDLPGPKAKDANYTFQKSQQMQINTSTINTQEIEETEESKSATMHGRKIEFGGEQQAPLMENQVADDNIKNNQYKTEEVQGKNGPMLQNQYLNLSNYVSQNFHEDSTNDPSQLLNSSKPLSNFHQQNTVQLLQSQLSNQQQHPSINNATLMTEFPHFQQTVAHTDNSLQSSLQQKVSSQNDTVKGMQMQKGFFEYQQYQNQADYDQNGVSQNEDSLSYESEEPTERKEKVQMHAISQNEQESVVPFSFQGGSNNDLVMAHTMDSNDTNVILNDSENSQVSYNKNVLPLQSPENDQFKRPKNFQKQAGPSKSSEAQMMAETAGDLPLDTEMSDQIAGKNGNLSAAQRIQILNQM